MALFIRDPEVDSLAEEIRKLTKSATKTEAVRDALRARVEELRRARPLEDRLARAKTMADELGPTSPTFDMKRFTDEMWGED